MPASDLTSARYTIVTHVYGAGPAFQLEAYLREKVARLVFIGHPFPFAADTRSFLRVYERGQCVVERWTPRWRGPDMGFYLKDVALTLWWTLRHGPADVFVGTGALNAWTGSLLKRFRRVRHLVFYAIDYVPQRFPGSAMNALYHWMERVAVARSEAVWNLSAAMVEAREGAQGLEREGKHVIVPIGTSSTREEPTPLAVQRHRIVYFGHLRPGQGVERVVAVLPDVIAQVPGAQLLIIGGGSLESLLRDEIARFGIGDHVHITGFLQDVREAHRLLRTSAIAVAPYVDMPENFTRYTDPGKVKEYLANGLPVVITTVPRVAEEIAARGCGIAIPDDPPALAEAVVRLLTDDALWQTCRQNARAFAQEITWANVFDRAFAESRAVHGV